MSDERALLAAIWEYPHEDTPRLIYADWLDEQGGAANAARAEFIRVQCELARTDRDTTHYGKLQARANKLQEAHTGAWKQGAGRGMLNASYERGFFRPQIRTFTVSEFLALKRGALDEAPAWDIELKSYIQKFDRFAACPNLARVGWLNLRRGCPGRCFNLLAASPHARHVGSLHAGLDGSQEWKPGAADAPGLAALTDFRLTAVMSGSLAAALADSPFAPTFSALRVSHNPALGAAGLAALARGDRFARLAVLDLGSCQFGPAELAPLAGAAPAPPLATLDLNNNPLGDKGLAALLAAPLSARLRSLGLSSTNLTDAGVETLARWPGAARLTGLNLYGNGIGPAGVEALTRAPLAQLRYLHLNNNPLNHDAEAIQSLRNRFAGGPTRVSLTRTATTEPLAGEPWVSLSPH